MNKLLKWENVFYYSFFLGLIAVILFMPQFAMAADANVGTLLKNPNVKTIITFGLALLATWKWFEYFANFAPGNAFLMIITPGVLTFLAFQWDKVLGWFGVI